MASTKFAIGLAGSSQGVHLVICANATTSHRARNGSSPFMALVVASIGGAWSSAESRCWVPRRLSTPVVGAEQITTLVDAFSPISSIPGTLINQGNTASGFVVCTSKD